MHIWADDSIIVTYKDFRENLVNNTYFIEIIEDADLVSFTNNCINNLYHGTGIDSKKQTAYAAYGDLVNKQG
jgi:hypothetical protein